jgi:hypothetical protein
MAAYRVVSPDGSADELVAFEVEGELYPISYAEGVHVAEELRINRGEGSVPLADRIERVLTTADEGPIIISRDAENVELQHFLGERPTHILALFNALRRQRGDPEFHPASPSSP